MLASRNYTVKFSPQGHIFFSKSCNDLGLEYGADIDFYRKDFENWYIVHGGKLSLVRHSENAPTMRTMCKAVTDKILKDTGSTGNLKVRIDPTEVKVGGGYVGYKLLVTEITPK